MPVRTTNKPSHLDRSSSRIGWLLVIVLCVSCTPEVIRAPGPSPVGGVQGLSPTAAAEPTALDRTPSETYLASPGPNPIALGSPTGREEPRPSPTQPETASATPSPPAAPSPTSTGTPTSRPSDTPTPSITPTYAILRGKVLQRANCRYGPGAPYLYKYGLVVGSNLEVFGRNDAGTWILIRAIGGTNPCWVKASLMEVKGDIMAVEPTYIPLPPSPYYGPLTGVGAVRHGNEVTVSWNALQLRAGDDTASAPHLLEAWVCQGGTLVFLPIGSYQNAVKVVDEPGCSEPSHGRVYGVEKHGYTRWVEVPWPEPGKE